MKCNLIEMLINVNEPANWRLRTGDVTEAKVLRSGRQWERKSGHMIMMEGGEALAPNWPIHQSTEAPD